LSFFESFRYIRRPPSGLFALPTGVPVCPAPQPLRDRPDDRAAFAAAGLPGRLPAWLPAGYAPIGCAACGGPAAGRSVLLRYGDGLEVLSVLETPSGMADPNPVSAHPGRRVWERDIPPLHIAVIGDDALPEALGRELLTALEPRSEAALRQGLAAHFGRPSLALAARLRRRGWGYDRIVALCLGRIGPGSPAGLERQARHWIVITLTDYSDRSR
jgi:hypothetical protein